MNTSVPLHPRRPEISRTGALCLAMILALIISPLSATDATRDSSKRSIGPVVTAANPAFSGVIGDPTDHAATVGLVFSVADPAFPLGELEVVASSSNPTVVASAALEIAAVGSQQVALRVAPSGVGYTTLTLTARNPLGEQSSAQVAFAASQAIPPLADTIWPIGGADASATVLLDPQHALVAIDEDQVLRVWPTTRSGPPIRSFDLTPLLGLTDFGGSGQPRESDFEAMALVGTRVYVMGSHSNSAEGANRPNRRRLAAFDLTGSAPDWTLSWVGRYDNLRDELLAWDQDGRHGLGVNALGLTSSAAVGTPPEAAGGSGFNLEGFAVSPDGQRAWLGFRAPLQPPSDRRLALVVPVNNLAALVSGNPATVAADFGTPALLDLGGLGVRSIECSFDGCLIVAGAADGSGGRFELYRWSGSHHDPPVRMAADLSGQRPEGVAFAANIVGPEAPLVLVSDLGDSVYYGDGVAAKDLPQALWRKFRLDRMRAGTPFGDAVFTSGFEP